VTPTGLQLIFNKYHQALSVLNVFFNYFVSSNGPNWEVICIIPIFGVIFGKNLVFAPPRVPIYRCNPHWFAINLEDMPQSFVLNVVFVILHHQMVQIGKLFA